MTTDRKRAIEIWDSWVNRADIRGRQDIFKVDDQRIESIEVDCIEAYITMKGMLNGEHLRLPISNIGFLDNSLTITLENSDVCLLIKLR